MKKQKLKWLIPCAAAIFTIGASMTSFAAQGWAEENGSWVYYDNNGDVTTDSWRKSGDSWFYLDYDGQLATSQLVETDGNYYYVNSVGAMVTSEWREVPSDYEEEDSPDTYWYYFGSNGRAYKAPSSGRTSFKSIKISNGQTNEYAFNYEGKMLFGWIDDSSTRVTGDDAWKEGTYYCGSPSDGARADGWRSLEVMDEPENDDFFDGSYWFYFRSNGKKLTDTTKTINGKKYRFDEYGAAQYDWYEDAPNASTSTASSSNQYYNLPEQCWQAKGWFKTVPSEELDEEGYDDGTEYWFYASNNGDLVKSRIKSINGIRYGFNEKGEMLHGLYKLTFDSERNIETYEEVETESELPEVDDASRVYYFGNSPKEGAMETGKTRIDLDGENYTFNFRKSGSKKGEGYNGIYDDSIYIQGRLLEADRYERYKVVEFEGKEYLVSTSGRLVKNRFNVKDGDDKYYVTNSDGTIKDSSYDKLSK
ncbi:cell wall-binding protein [Lacrimispora amygdalina]|uniref:cell wall-binding protein n=1 Tax=Lacrimispora amygdalina TaxID=253257 RepID=UPI000BE3839B|nr:cell wall-binding protein [Lacrimispora amygdalina]